ncbi:mevalonate kinase [Nocardia sp. NPDC050408]|uniref:mevalonate kinase n=1 Tax=Nocardia sp. NPDC050408 TaxID=3364319 RepID=UPI0037AB2BB3
MRTLTMGTGHAHGKVVLLGEHAVVYGMPAMAVPLPELAVLAQARRLDEAPGIAENCPGPPGPSTGYRFLATRSTAAATSGIQVAAAEALCCWGTHDDAVEVTVSAGFPAGRGLGSSAAGAVAVARAFADLYGANADTAAIHRLAQHGEQLEHGRSSGVDAAAAASTSPLWFEAEQSHGLTADLDAVVVIADSGLIGSTRRAVATAAPLLQGTAGRARLMHAAELTRCAAADLATGRAAELGDKLIQFHEWLRELGVSCPQLDRLVAAALAAGALGAKLTGGGLGGCMLALTTGPDQATTVRDALTAAGATQTWSVATRGWAA